MPTGTGTRQAIAKSRFTEEQTIVALRQAQAGTSVEEICRKHGVPESRFFRWKKQHGDLAVAKLREMRQLRTSARKIVGSGCSPTSRFIRRSCNGAPTKITSPAHCRAVATWARDTHRLRAPRAVQRGLRDRFGTRKRGSR
jgi:putative transposase